MMFLFCVTSILDINVEEAPFNRHGNRLNLMLNQTAQNLKRGKTVKLPVFLSSPLRSAASLFLTLLCFLLSFLHSS